MKEGAGEEMCVTDEKILGTEAKPDGIHLRRGLGALREMGN